MLESLPGKVLEMETSERQVEQFSGAFGIWRSLILVVVRERGFEPLQVSPLDPKSSASASSATLALDDFGSILQVILNMIKPFPSRPILTILCSFCKMKMRKRILCRETGPQEPSGHFCSLGSFICAFGLVRFHPFFQVE